MNVDRHKPCHLSPESMGHALGHCRGPPITRGNTSEDVFIHASRKTDGGPSANFRFTF